jgi:hypothetical protein
MSSCTLYKKVFKHESAAHVGYRVPRIILLITADKELIRLFFAFLTETFFLRRFKVTKTDQCETHYVTLQKIPESI